MSQPFLFPCLALFGNSANLREFRAMYSGRTKPIPNFNNNCEKACASDFQILAPGGVDRFAQADGHDLFCKIQSR